MATDQTSNHSTANANGKSVAANGTSAGHAATEPRRGLIARLWAANGLWALGDQAVCSAGNFLTGVLLARTLDKHEFGIYSLLLSVLMFLNSLHGALVTYPLTLHGSAVPLPRFRQLVVRGLSFTAIMSPILAIVIVGATLRVESVAMLPWVLLALFLWQAQETTRRSLLARLRHRAAIPGDAVSFLGQAACIWMLSRSHNLTPALAFISIAATSAIAVIIQLSQILFTRVAAIVGVNHVETSPRDIAPSLTSEAVHWWKTGRWLLVTSMVNVGTVYLPPWVLEAFRGETEVASATALMALLNLTNPVLFSLAGLVVAAVARSRATASSKLEGIRTARRVAVRYALAGLALVLPYYVVVLTFPTFILRLFYGPDSPYQQLAGEVPLVVLMYATLYVSQMGVSLMNGLGEARGSFLATLTSSIAMVVLGVPLTWKFGLHGSLVAGTLPLIAQLVVTLRMIRQLEQRAVAEQSAQCIAAAARPPEFSPVAAVGHE